MMINTLVPPIQAQVRLCPVPLILQEIRIAAHEYFKNSQCWKHTDNFKTQIGINEYTIYTPPETSPCAVHFVSFNNFPIQSAIGRVNTTITAPSCRPLYWKYNQNLLYLFPEVTEIGDVSVAVSLTTDEYAKQFPDFVEQHILVDGTLARLFSMAGQEWTDYNAAQYYEARFKEHTASDKIKTWKGNNPQSATIVTPPFGG